MDTKPVGAVPFDPLADAVLKEYIQPAITELDRLLARDEDAAAARAIVFQLGAGMVRLARLTAGLDTAALLPEKTGAFVGDYTFSPTVLDAPETRAEAAAKIRGPLPTLYVGQYL
jgi:hypothetical protein